MELIKQIDNLSLVFEKGTYRIYQHGLSEFSSFKWILMILRESGWEGINLIFPSQVDYDKLNELKGLGNNDRYKNEKER